MSNALQNVDDAHTSYLSFSFTQAYLNPLKILHSKARKLSTRNNLPHDKTA